MKNKLTKIYNIFKQIENMNGSVGWDQIDVFYYFYEEHKNYLACWQLLYGLFSENKTLKPTIFGITLTELRKFSDAKSVIYTFENSEEPILVATFERNGKHQVSGTVKIEDTLLTDEKEVIFVDGMNLDSEVDNSINKQISLSFSFFDYIEKFYALSDNELKSIIGKLKNIDGFTIYIDIDNKVQWLSEENLSEEIADKLVELLHSKTNTEKIIDLGLIENETINNENYISSDEALKLISNYIPVFYYNKNNELMQIQDQEGWFEAIDELDSLENKFFVNESIITMEDYIKSIVSDYEFNAEFDAFMGFLNYNPSDSGSYTNLAIELSKNPEKYQDLLNKYNLAIEGVPNEEEMIFSLKKDPKFFAKYVVKSPELIEWEISYLKNENPHLSLKWVESLGGNVDWLKKLKILLDSKNVDYDFFKKYLIDIDQLTSREIEDLDYVEDRLETHLEDFVDDTNSGIFNPKTMITEFTDLTDDEAYERVKKELNVNYHDNDDDLKTINSVVEFDLVINEIGTNSNRFFYFDNDGQFPTFKINGETPDTLNDLDEVSQFLDYLYDDCELLGGFHPDDNFDNYIDDLTKKPIFTKEQQELYSKYIDDMFEMDSDGVSVFVQDGYEDVYDYCMNYRNDSYVKKEFDFVAYVEDDKLSVGIKSDTEFEGSEDLGDNAYTKYMTFSPREEGFFPEYNNLRITWGDDTNSWNVETNSGFSMLDIRIHQAWEEEENETSNIESIINKFVTSLETQRNFNAEVFFLIKSELSKSLDKNFVINKIKNIGEDIFSAVRCELVGTKLFCYESFLYDGVNVDINTASVEFDILHTGEIKFFNSEGEFMYRAEIETSDVFGFGDYIIKRFTNDWKSTTPAELSQFFDELSKDFQFDKNDENFLGFINIDTEEDKSDDYTVMRYIIHNKKEAEKYANKYGLTIESAQEGELIVNLLNNNSENNDVINYDFLAYEEDGKLSVGIRTQKLPEKYPSSINFIPDGSGDWFTDIYFEKGENSGKELENIFGLVVKANKDGWVVTGSNGFNETIKLDSENSGIVELSYKEQIDWLNKFIDDWNGIDTNDQFADKKMTKMSADLKAFCYVNGLLLMSADDLLMEISDKNQLLGPINVNGIVYKTKLIRDEDNENKYNLEFYKLEGDAQSELVGDCELIYDERTSSIDEIVWTLPEYELIIDPEDELFESEALHEMISNIELK
jgi:hypothetical protein